MHQNRGCPLKGPPLKLSIKWREWITFSGVGNFAVGIPNPGPECLNSKFPWTNGYYYVKVLFPSGFYFLQVFLTSFLSGALSEKLAQWLHPLKSPRRSWAVRWSRSQKRKKCSGTRRKPNQGRTNLSFCITFLTAFWGFSDRSQGTVNVFLSIWWPVSFFCGRRTSSSPSLKGSSWSRLKQIVLNKSAYRTSAGMGEILRLNSQILRLVMI